VADVAAPAAELTPAVVQQHLPAVQQAGLLVLDANLQQPTLAAAAQAAAAAGVPVLFEPVSVPKSVRWALFVLTAPCSRRACAMPSVIASYRSRASKDKLVMQSVEQACCCW
jgi:hypothetical protein